MKSFGWGIGELLMHIIGLETARYISLNTPLNICVIVDVGHEGPKIFTKKTGEILHPAHAILQALYLYDSR